MSSLNMNAFTSAWGGPHGALWKYFMTSKHECNSEMWIQMNEQNISFAVCSAYTEFAPCVLLYCISFLTTFSAVCTYNIEFC